MNKSDQKALISRPNANNDIMTYHIPEIITITPSNHPPYPPAYTFAMTKDGIDPSQISFPWAVPKLNLIQPTPPASRAGSVRAISPRPTSPVLEPDEIKEVTPGVKQSPSPTNVATYDLISKKFMYDVPRAASEKTRATSSPLHESMTVEDITDDYQPLPGDPDPVSDVRSGHIPGAFEDDVDFAATLATGLKDSGFDPSIVTDDPTYRRRTSPPHFESISHTHQEAPHVQAPSAGNYGDDLEFAATLAAGLQDTGFDPSIVVEDPTFHRRDSPPGSEQKTFYATPFAQTVTDLGFDSPGTEGAPPQQGFVEGEIAPTPKADFGRRVTSDYFNDGEMKPTRQDKKRREEQAALDDRHAQPFPSAKPAVTMLPEGIAAAVSSKPSKREQRKRDSARQSLQSGAATATEPSITPQERSVEPQAQYSNKDQESLTRYADTKTIDHSLTDIDPRDIDSRKTGVDTSEKQESKRSKDTKDVAGPGDTLIDALPQTSQVEKASTRRSLDTDPRDVEPTLPSKVAVGLPTSADVNRHSGLPDISTDPEAIHYRTNYDANIREIVPPTSAPTTTFGQQDVHGGDYAHYDLPVTQETRMAAKDDQGRLNEQDRSVESPVPISNYLVDEFPQNYPIRSQERGGSPPAQTLNEVPASNKELPEHLVKDSVDDYPSPTKSKSKSKSKSSKPIYETFEAAPGGFPVTPHEDQEEPDYAEVKQGSKRYKSQDSDPGFVASDMTRSDYDDRKKSRDKLGRDELDNFESPFTDVRSVVTEPVQEDFEKTRRTKLKKSKRNSLPNVSPARDPMAVAALDLGRDETIEPRKSKKSKRRTVDFDDTASVETAPATFDDHESSRQTKKEKKGGLFGLFGGSKSSETVAESRKSKDTTQQTTFNDFEEPKRKSKRSSHDKSASDSLYDTLGDAAQSVSNVSEVSSTQTNGCSRDDEDGHRRHKSRDKEEKRRSREESGRSTQDQELKDQNLTDISTTRALSEAEDISALSASVGFKDTSDTTKSTPGLPNLGGQPDVPVVESEHHISKSAPSPPEAFKSDISPVTANHPILPTLDNQADGLPPLPLSPPSSPTAEHDPQKRRPSSIHTPDRIQTLIAPPKVASPTAIPIHFRKPRPLSWSARSSPQTSPSGPDDSPVSGPRQRGPRPTSTEFRTSSEFRPLWLVERHSSRSVKLLEEYPPLPESRSASESASLVDPDEVHVDPDLGAKLSNDATDLGITGETTKGLQHGLGEELARSAPDWMHSHATDDLDRAQVTALSPPSSPSRIVHGVKDLFPDHMPVSQRQQVTDIDKGVPTVPVDRHDVPFIAPSDSEPTQLGSAVDTSATEAILNDAATAAASALLPGIKERHVGENAAEDSKSIAPGKEAQSISDVSTERKVTPGEAEQLAMARTLSRKKDKKAKKQAYAGQSTFDEPPLPSVDDDAPFSSQETHQSVNQLHGVDEPITTEATATTEPEIPVLSKSISGKNKKGRKRGSTISLDFSQQEISSDPPILPHETSRDIEHNFELTEEPQNLNPDPVEPDRPVLSRTTSKKDKKSKKQSKDAKSSATEATPTGGKEPTAEMSMLGILSPQEQKRLQEQDAQDAVDSWFDPPSPTTYKKTKKGKKRGQSIPTFEDAPSESILNVPAPASGASATAGNEQPAALVPVAPSTDLGEEATLSIQAGVSDNVKDSGISQPDVATVAAEKPLVPTSTQQEVDFPAQENDLPPAEDDFQNFTVKPKKGKSKKKKSQVVAVTPLPEVQPVERDAASEEIHDIPELDPRFVAAVEEAARSGTDAIAGIVAEPAAILPTITPEPIATSLEDTPEASPAFEGAAEDASKANGEEISNDLTMPVDDTTRTMQEEKSDQYDVGPEVDDAFVEAADATTGTRTEKANQALDDRLEQLARSSELEEGPIFKKLEHTTQYTPSLDHRDPLQHSAPELSVVPTSTDHVTDEGINVPEFDPDFQSAAEDASRLGTEVVARNVGLPTQLQEPVRPISAASEIEESPLPPQTDEEVQALLSESKLTPNYLSESEISKPEKVSATLDDTLDRDFGGASKKKTKGKKQKYDSLPEPEPVPETPIASTTQDLSEPVSQLPVAAGPEAEYEFSRPSPKKSKGKKNRKQVIFSESVPENPSELPFEVTEATRGAVDEEVERSLESQKAPTSDDWAEPDIRQVDEPQDGLVRQNTPTFEPEETFQKQVKKKSKGKKNKNQTYFAEPALEVLQPGIPQSADSAQMETDEEVARSFESQKALTSDDWDKSMVAEPEILAPLQEPPTVADPEQDFSMPGKKKSKGKKKRSQISWDEPEVEVSADKAPLTRNAYSEKTTEDSIPSLEGHDVPNDTELIKSAVGQKESAVPLEDKMIAVDPEDEFQVPSKNKSKGKKKQRQSIAFEPEPEPRLPLNETTQNTVIQDVDAQIERASQEFPAFPAVQVSEHDPKPSQPSIDSDFFKYTPLDASQDVPVEEQVQKEMERVVQDFPLVLAGQESVSSPGPYSNRVDHKAVEEPTPEAKTHDEREGQSPFVVGTEPDVSLETESTQRTTPKSSFKHEELAAKEADAGIIRAFEEFPPVAAIQSIPAVSTPTPESQVVDSKAFDTSVNVQQTAEDFPPVSIVQEAEPTFDFSSPGRKKKGKKGKGTQRKLESPAPEVVESWVQSDVAEDTRPVDDLPSLEITNAAKVVPSVAEDEESASVSLELRTEPSIEPRPDAVALPEVGEHELEELRDEPSTQGLGHEHSAHAERTDRPYFAKDKDAQIPLSKEPELAGTFESKTISVQPELQPEVPNQSSSSHDRSFIAGSEPRIVEQPQIDDTSLASDSLSGIPSQDLEPEKGLSHDSIRSNEQDLAPYLLGIDDRIDSKEPSADSIPLPLEDDADLADFQEKVRMNDEQLSIGHDDGENEAAPEAHGSSRSSPQASLKDLTSQSYVGSTTSDQALSTPLKPEGNFVQTDSLPEISPDSLPIPDYQAAQPTDNSLDATGAVSEPLVAPNYIPAPSPAEHALEARNLVADASTLFQQPEATPPEPDQLFVTSSKKKGKKGKKQRALVSEPDPGPWALETSTASLPAESIESSQPKPDEVAELASRTSPVGVANDVGVDTPKPQQETATPSSEDEEWGFTSKKKGKKSKKQRDPSLTPAPEPASTEKFEPDIAEVPQHNSRQVLEETPSTADVPSKAIEEPSLPSLGDFEPTVGVATPGIEMSDHWGMPSKKKDKKAKKSKQQDVEIEPSQPRLDTMAQVTSNRPPEESNDVDEPIQEIQTVPQDAVGELPTPQPEEQHVTAEDAEETWALPSSKKAKKGKKSKLQRSMSQEQSTGTFTPANEPEIVTETVVPVTVPELVEVNDRIFTKNQSVPVTEDLEVPTADAADSWALPTKKKGKKGKKAKTQDEDALELMPDTTVPAVLPENTVPELTDQSRDIAQPLANTIDDVSNKLPSSETVAQDTPKTDNENSWAFPVTKKGKKGKKDKLQLEPNISTGSSTPAVVDEPKQVIVSEPLIERSSSPGALKRDVLSNLPITQERDVEAVEPPPDDAEDMWARPTSKKGKKGKKGKLRTEPESNTGSFTSAAVDEPKQERATESFVERSESPGALKRDILGDPAITKEQKVEPPPANTEDSWALPVTKKGKKGKKGKLQSEPDLSTGRSTPVVADEPKQEEVSESFMERSQSPGILKRNILNNSPSNQDHDVEPPSANAEDSWALPVTKKDKKGKKSKQYQDVDSGTATPDIATPAPELPSSVTETTQPETTLPEIEPEFRVKKSKKEKKKSKKQPTTELPGNREDNAPLTPDLSSFTQNSKAASPYLQSLEDTVSQASNANKLTEAPINDSSAANRATPGPEFHLPSKTSSQEPFKESRDIAQDQRALDAEIEPQHALPETATSSTDSNLKSALREPESREDNAEIGENVLEKHVSFPEVDIATAIPESDILPDITPDPQALDDGISNQANQPYVSSPLPTESGIHQELEPASHVQEPITFTSAEADQPFEPNDLPEFNLKKTKMNKKKAKKARKDDLDWDPITPEKRDTPPTTSEPVQVIQDTAIPGIQADRNPFAGEDADEAAVYEATLARALAEPGPSLDQPETRVPSAQGVVRDDTEVPRTESTELSVNRDRGEPQVDVNLGDTMNDSNERSNMEDIAHQPQQSSPQDEGFSSLVTKKTTKKNKTSKQLVLEPKSGIANIIEPIATTQEPREVSEDVLDPANSPLASDAPRDLDLVGFSKDETAVGNLSSTIDEQAQDGLSSQAAGHSPNLPSLEPEIDEEVDEEASGYSSKKKNKKSKKKQGKENKMADDKISIVTLNPITEPTLVEQLAVEVPSEYTQEPFPEVTIAPAAEPEIDVESDEEAGGYSVRKKGKKSERNARTSGLDDLPKRGERSDRELKKPSAADVVSQPRMPGESEVFSENPTTNEHTEPASTEQVVLDTHEPQDDFSSFVTKKGKKGQKKKKPPSEAFIDYEEPKEVVRDIPSMPEAENTTPSLNPNEPASKPTASRPDDTLHAAEAPRENPELATLSNTQRLPDVDDFAAFTTKKKGKKGKASRKQSQTSTPLPEAEISLPTIDRGTEAASKLQEAPQATLPSTGEPLAAQDLDTSPKATARSLPLVPSGEPVQTVIESNSKAHISQEAAQYDQQSPVASAFPGLKRVSAKPPPRRPSVSETVHRRSLSLSGVTGVSDKKKLFDNPADVRLETSGPFEGIEPKQHDLQRLGMHRLSGETFPDPNSVPSSSAKETEAFVQSIDQTPERALSDDTIEALTKEPTLYPEVPKEAPRSFEDMTAVREADDRNILDNLAPAAAAATLGVVATIGEENPNKSNAQTKKSKKQKKSYKALDHQSQSSSRQPSPPMTEDVRDPLQQKSTILETDPFEPVQPEPRASELSRSPLTSPTLHSRSSKPALHLADDSHYVDDLDISDFEPTETSQKDTQSDQQGEKVNQNRDSALHVTDSPMLPSNSLARNVVRDSGFHDAGVSPVVTQSDEPQTGRTPLQMSPQWQNKRSITPIGERSSASLSTLHPSATNTSSSDEHGLNISVELDPSYELSVSRHRDSQSEQQSSNDSDRSLNIEHTRGRRLSPARSMEDFPEPSPVDSTTKDRDSMLFESSPAFTEQLHEHARDSSLATHRPHGEHLSTQNEEGLHLEGAISEEVPSRRKRERSKSNKRGSSSQKVTSASTHKQQPSLFGGPLGVNSDRPELHTPRGSTPGYNGSERATLNTIAEQSPEESPLHRKKSRTRSDVGSPPHALKAARRTITPKHDLHKEVSAISPQPTGPTPSTDPRSVPRDPNLISTDELISRLSWPSVNENEHTVNIKWVKSRDTDRRSRSRHSVSPATTIHPLKPREVDHQSVSGQSVRSTGSGQQYRTLEREQMRSASGLSNQSSGTPPLRRVTPVSGDLRAVNKRSKAKLTKDSKAELTKREPELDQLDPLESSSSIYDPINDKGKGRARDMTDVYED